MDWKKILEASKWPIAAVAVLTILTPIINLSLGYSIAAIFGIPVLLLSLGVTFWLGFNGVKKHKFEYSDSAKAGAMLGITTGIVSFAFIVFLIVTGLYHNLIPSFVSSNAVEAQVAAQLSAALFTPQMMIFTGILNGTLGTVVAIIVTLFGAFIAKKLK